MTVYNIDTKVKVGWRKRRYFRDALWMMKNSAIFESGAKWNVSEVKSFMSSRFVINIDQVSKNKADHILDLIDECETI